MSTCVEFFYLSPADHWVKIDKGRMCNSCLTSKSVCKSRRCSNNTIVPKVLKCAICALWVTSKGLAQFSIFFCKQKEHGDSRAPLPDLKRELEKYILKLGTAVVDTKIQFATNFMFQTPYVAYYLCRTKQGVYSG